VESDKVLEFYERRIFVVVVVVVSSQVRFWGEGKEEEEQQQSYLENLRGLGKTLKVSKKGSRKKLPSVFSSSSRIQSR